MTTVGDWLRRRTIQPPDALAARIVAVLGPALDQPAESAPDVCIDAAEGLVAELLRADATSRNSALDLLTADALATYAFEAASEQPGALGDRAEAAMARIAALGSIAPG